MTIEQQIGMWSLNAATAQTILTALQTVGAFVAVVLAWVAYRQTQNISADQQKQTEKIHQEQTALAEKQAFIALFEHTKELRYIPPKVKNWDDAINSANLIELIGVACSKKIVKEKLLFAVYGRLVVKIYEQIRDAQDETTGEYLGKEILNDASGATAIYDRWKQPVERIKQKQLAKVGKSNGAVP